MNSTNQINQIKKSNNKTLNNNPKQTKFLGRKFAARHRARELAVQFLYALDMRPEQDSETSLELFLNPSDNEIERKLNNASDSDSDSASEKEFLNTIYQNYSHDKIKNIWTKNNQNNFNIINEQTDTPDVKTFCKNLVHEVLENSDEIDTLLLRALTGWRPERMVSVDRTVLRLIILEACIKKTLPLKSAMTEAANLADNFGTKDSARFVNGVLSKIFKLLEQNPE